ncbi:serine/threonine protein kinase [Thermosporothrix hazakensis]|uniref:serine/threonine protein kinase n=1 Tax=Thermosporothrix hazakensis TaxID=644383 RepID=UPI002482613D|nr:protein kinase [Thermosporothrix hazakensis]
MSCFETTTRYRTLRLLGEGCGGTVFLARDLQRRARVAIKVATPEKIHHEASVLQLLHEASLPVPAVLDTLELEENQSALVMEYIAGTSLEKALKAPLSSSLAISLAEQLLQGIASLHQHQFVHGDIHSRNILLHRSKIWLIDFEQARRVTTTSHAFGHSPFWYDCYQLFTILQCFLPRLPHPLQAWNVQAGALLATPDLQAGALLDLWRSCKAAAARKRNLAAFLPMFIQKQSR